MNAIIVFMMQIIISFILSGATLWALNKPLKNILEELCPSVTHAAFWVAYTRIMISAAPLFLVLLISRPFSFTLMDPSVIMMVIKSSVVAALTGLLLGLFIVGRKVIAPVQAVCDQS